MKATPDVPPVLRELVVDILEAAKESSLAPPDFYGAYAGDYHWDVRSARRHRLEQIAIRLEAIAATLEASWKPRTRGDGLCPSCGEIDPHWKPRVEGICATCGEPEPHRADCEWLLHWKRLGHR